MMRPWSVAACGIFLGIVSIGTLDARPEGALEQINQRKVKGWAFDPDHPDRSVKIELRFVAEGRALETLTCIASQERPELRPLFVQAGQPNAETADEETTKGTTICHGFEVALGRQVSADGSDPTDGSTLVELRAQDQAGAWSLLTVSTVPHPSDVLASLAVSEIEAIVDPTGETLIVMAEVGPGSQVLAPAASTIGFRVDVWGQSGNWTTETVNPSHEDGQTTITRISLAANTAIRDALRRTGTVVVALWAFDRSEPSREKRIAAAERGVWE